MARAAAFSLLSRLGEGGSARAAAISSLSVSNEAVGGRRGAKASARALQLPQRPARCRGRALAAASVLGWPGGRARATLHQLLVMPLLDAATSSRADFCTADCRHSLRRRYGSNDAQRALSGAVLGRVLSKLHSQARTMSRFSLRAQASAGLRALPRFDREGCVNFLCSREKPVP